MSPAASFSLMALEISHDQALSLIRSRDKVAVFLHLPEDELCTRALGGLSSCEDRLRGLGYQIVSLAVGPKSSSHEDLSCVRVPQLRFFVNGRLAHKSIGPIDDVSMDIIFRSI